MIHFSFLCLFLCNVLLFEAEDCNDPMWEYVIAILSENIPGFSVGYGNGNWMAFAIPKE